MNTGYVMAAWALYSEAVVRVCIRIISAIMFSKFEESLDRFMQHTIQVVALRLLSRVQTTLSKVKSFMKLRLL